MSNKVEYIEWVVIAIVIGLLNWWAAPTMSDDILYRFVWQEDWNQPLQPIQSVSDIITSQSIHYEVINGRSIVHGVAQAILNLVPEDVTKIVNTIIFLLLIILTNIYIVRNKSYNNIVTALAFGFIFLIINGFESGFIWTLGAANYLWTLTLNLLFLIIIRRHSDKTANWTLLPLLPIAFLAGWTHEAIALPLSLAFLLYMAVNRKSLFSKATTYLMVAYIAGMAMILASPALWGRADLGGIPLVQRLFLGTINLVFGIRISWLLVITLVYLYFRNRNKFFQETHSHLYLLFAWLTSLGIVFLCGTTLERVTICADFLAMLILLSLWQGKRLIRYQKPVITLIAITSLCVASTAIRLNRMNYQNYLYHIEQLHNPSKSLIKVKQLPADMSKWEAMIASRYVFPTIEFSFYNCYMAFDKQDINTIAAARLAGRGTVAFLPEDVVEKIERDTTAFLDFDMDKHERLFVSQLQQQSHRVDSVIFLLGPEVPLKLYQRVMTYKGDEFELDPFNYELLTINNRKYLVMTVPPTNIKRRIKEISIK